jgi:hypothetical protein
MYSVLYGVSEEGPDTGPTYFIKGAMDNASLHKSYTYPILANIILFIINMEFEIQLISTYSTLASKYYLFIYSC